jgi:hypothetical protein
LSLSIHRFVEISMRFAGHDIVQVQRVDQGIA